MALINGTNSADILIGTNQDDVIKGFAGDDVLFGLAGNDLLIGGLGADAMAGGSGNDTYIVNDASDVVVEGLNDGIDRIISSISLSLSVTGRLDVENLALSGFASLDGFGNALDNVIRGNSADNTLSGFGGDDKLLGLGGDDFLFGGSGDDLLNGGTGRDEMHGGAGNDTYVVDNRHDVVAEAGGGIDRIITSISLSLNSTGKLAVENLRLTGSANLNGTGNALDNTIIGNSGNNHISGLNGDDTLFGLAGSDRLSGGNGDDHLLGGLGNDVLSGGNGNDTLNGQDGADTIFTGAGTDTIVFNTALGAGNIDHVMDFTPAVDKFQLDSAVFTGLPAGPLAADAFVIGAAAADANDRIIYNDTSGALSFDADGTGATAQVQFALLGTGLALTNNDFVIV
jgi:Ca2+-binding RTX toxin-like protein